MKAVIITITLLVVFAYVSSPATIIDIPDDYPTIQQGIDASIDEDTVLVQPGTYYENINFNGHDIVLGSLFLTMQDTTYISSTIIDDNQAGSVVTFESGEESAATIIGFTIRNGSAYYFGGGIYCANGSNPTISYNRIIENEAGAAGAGICIHHSDPTISHNIISGNEVNGGDGSNGGGISCWYGSPVISDNIISQNVVTAFEAYGGGISCGNSNAIISGNIISENSQDAIFGYGGGIAGHGGFFIKDNIITANFAPMLGGGIYCSGNITIRNNIITANLTQDGGAGVYYQGECLIYSNTIAENQAEYSGLGNGILCDYECSSSIVKNSIIWENGDIEIHFFGSPGQVIYCDIQGGWEGEGNIDCDPQFCDPENGDYHLHYNSCCVGAGQDGADIGAFGVGCGLLCDSYVIGDFNGSESFNVADIVDAYSKLKTGQPDAELVCECPPESGNDWAVAMDLNNSCSFNVADIVDGYSNLKTGSPELQSCEFCPPEG